MKSEFGVPKKHPCDTTEKPCYWEGLANRATAKNYLLLKAQDELIAAINELIDAQISAGGRISTRETDAAERAEEAIKKARGEVKSA